MAEIDTLPPSVVHTTGSFINARQYSIFTQTWMPPNPKALVLIVHGLGEHSGRYSRFVNHLLEQNFAVFALDHESHGRSQGEHEYVEKVQNIVDDVVVYTQQIIAAHPTLPRVLFGHSMGGCISLCMCIQHPHLFNWAIFSAPTTARPPTVNAILKALGCVVGKVAPRLRVTALDTSTLCRDPTVFQNYQADPLVWHLNISAGFGYDILAVGDQLLIDAARFTTPCLFLSGTADRIVSPEGSYRFFQTCASPDKTYIKLTGWYHELLHEPEAEQLLPHITNWINERLALPDGAVRVTNAELIGTVGEDGILRIVPVDH